MEALGKSSMDAKALLENFSTFAEAVKKTKPASSKGVFVKSLTLTSTMGPAVHVDPSYIA
jgi:large subunit ribosomal protein L1